MGILDFVRRDPIFLGIACAFTLLALAFVVVAITRIAPADPPCAPAPPGQVVIDGIGCGGGRTWTTDSTMAAVGAGSFAVLAAAALTYGLRRRVR